jgi:hypothetical protein
MDCTRGDQKFLSDRRVTNLPGDLEFHFAFRNKDQFVGGVRGILPPPSGRVGPEDQVIRNSGSVSPGRQKDQKTRSEKKNKM